MSFWIRVKGMKELPAFSENGLVVSWDKIKSLMDRPLNKAEL
jgi:hypothetical protein